MKVIRLVSPCWLLLLLCVLILGTLLYHVGPFHTANQRAEVIVQGKHSKYLNKPKIDVKTQEDVKADNRKRYLTPQLPGRLGNGMFAYASTIGIASRNDLTPMFPEKHYLRNVFKLTAANYSNENIKSWVKVKEVTAGSYDSRTEALHDIDADMLELNGYFQSWKYFDHIRHIIKKEFSFQDNIQARADHFIKEGIAYFFGPDIQRDDVILIGVHVRRGDMESTYNIDRGYTVADPTYLKHAMEYFESQFNTTTKKLAFIMCSDSPDWVEFHQPETNFPVVPSRFNSESMDLAILSSCDHTIMTVGTYGWWAAYLAGGKTVYYGKYARLNSDLHKEIVPEDYFCPDWIPLT